MIRYFWVLRAYALRAGELTGLGDDIFFLEAAEIVRALDGETISPTAIRERRAAYEGYCALPNYPALIRGRFDPYAWAADPHRRSDRFIEGEAGLGGRTHRARVPGIGRGRRGAGPGAGGGARTGRPLRAGEVLVTTVHQRRAGPRSSRGRRR